MRTVFVIGAGANAEIGMPVGNELKTKIADILRFKLTDDGMLCGDSTICESLEMYSRNHYGVLNTMKLNSLINAAEGISMAMPLSISIDNFIEARRDDQEIAFCGKLAIVHTIREAEYNCKLFEAKVEQLNDTWYPLLFQKITEGCHINELVARFNNISFIIFNYDRCFEYFIYFSLMVYYNIDHDRAKKIVQGLHINHPYGTVGNLWDNKGDLTFRKIPDSEQLIKLAQNIKTFTESIDQEKDSSNRIQYLAERADRIIFLGFAYHDQNLDVLFRHHGALYVLDKVPISENITCYGTGYGISDKDLDLLRETLQTKCKTIKDCDISQMKCSEFFRDFWYRLTFKDA